jgi:2-keto-3-deoxy-L-rhamnonate aldolase RhmA
MAEWRERLASGDLRHPVFRARIRDHELLLAAFVKSRDPATTEALAVAGYDFIVVDLEHSPLSVADVEGIVRTCDAYDVPVIARIPEAGLGLSGQLLDVGVTGLQVSDVTSAAAALAVRAAAHYPPVGQRSLALSTRAARFGAVPASKHIPSSLAQTVLIGQIESREGLAALASILDTRVFDALFFGPADMSVSLREPGREVVHPDVASALGEATGTILGRGTPLGIACADAADAKRWAERGLTYLVISTDLGMLRTTAQSVLGQLRPRA